MLTPARALIIILLLFFTYPALLPLGVRAQDHDVRLTSEILQPRLPDSVLLQYGARVANRTLVVWSTSLDAGADTRIALMGQFVDHIALPKDSSTGRYVPSSSGRNVPYGRPFEITNTAAGPSRALVVVNVNDHFVVAWLDVRFSPAVQIRVRVVDTAGTLGPVAVLANGVDFDPARFDVIPIPRGYRYVWQASGLGAVMTRDADTLGVPILPLRVVQLPAMERAAPVAGDPDLTAIAIGRTIWLVDSSGVPQIAPVMGDIPPDALVFLSRAGGVIASRDSLSRAEYDTPLSRKPDRLVWPYLDDSSRAFSRPRISMWDRNQKVSITYLTQFTFLGGGGSNVWLDYLLYLVRHTIYTDGSTRPPPGEFDWESPYTTLANGGQSRSHFDTFYVDRVWEKQERATLVFVRIALRHRNQWVDDHGKYHDSVYYDTVGFYVTPRSRMDSYVSEWAAADNATRVIRTATLGHGSVVLVGSRDSSDKYSATRVVPDSVVLSAPIVPRWYNVVDRSPCVTYKDDQVLVGWIQRELTPKARLARWRRDAGDGLVWIGSIDLPDSLYSLSSWKRTPSAIESVGSGFYLMACGLLPDGYGTLSMFLPLTHEWVQRQTSQYDTYPGVAYLPQCGVSPAGRRSVALCRSKVGSDSVSVLYSYQDGGLFLGQQAGPFRRMDVILPLVESVLGAITVADGGVDVWRWDRSIYQNVRVRSRRTGMGGPARAYMLPDGGVLWWHTEYGADSTFVIELLDTVLNLRAQYTAPAAGIDPTWVDVVRNPSDHGFACVIARPDGIRLRPLDSLLRPSRAEEVLTSSARPGGRPSGTYAGDSLVVVWEDRRNGISDIYGLVVSAPTPAGVESSPITARSDLTVVPNPARGRVDVLLGEPAGAGARWALSDNLSRVVRSGAVEPGVASVGIALDGLAPGAYTVMVQISVDRYRAARLVVW